MFCLNNLLESENGLIVASLEIITNNVSLIRINKFVLIKCCMNCVSCNHNNYNLN